MQRRARPCASIRVHALQCAPMRLLVQPYADGEFSGIFVFKVTLQSVRLLLSVD